MHNLCGSEPGPFSFDKADIEVEGFIDIDAGTYNDFGPMPSAFSGVPPGGTASSRQKTDARALAGTAEGMYV